MGCLLSIKLKYEDYDWSELPDGKRSSIRSISPRMLQFRRTPQSIPFIFRHCATNSNRSTLFLLFHTKKRGEKLLKFLDMTNVNGIRERIPK
mmetsp:Transcript_6476/g.9854  ORF Transcript_6476/g.9854 Transcript_6476/m.9854 type:complete len:92 (+) Transcript_6476:1117-1392(+)